MKKVYPFKQTTIEHFLRNVTLSLLFFSSVLMLGLNEGKAQSSFDINFSPNINSLGSVAFNDQIITNGSTIYKRTRGFGDNFVFSNSLSGSVTGTPITITNRNRLVTAEIGTTVTIRVYEIAEDQSVSLIKTFNSTFTFNAIGSAVVQANDSGIIISKGNERKFQIFLNDTGGTDNYGLGFSVSDTGEDFEGIALYRGFAIVGFPTSNRALQYFSATFTRQISAPAGLFRFGTRIDTDNSSYAIASSSTLAGTSVNRVSFYSGASASFFSPVFLKTISPPAFSGFAYGNSRLIVTDRFAAPTNNTRVYDRNEGGTNNYGNVEVYTGGIFSANEGTFYERPSGSVAVTRSLFLFPYINSTSPAVSASNIDPTSNLTMTLNMSVMKGTGDIRIINSSTDEIIETIDVTSLAVTVSGSTVTIDPASDLPASTSIAVEMDRGAIEGTNFYHFEGLFSGDPSPWTFTTSAPPPNNPPTNIILSSATIQENNANDATIGTFTTVDLDGTDTHDYSIIPIAGSTDDLSFDIDGNQLVAAVVFDFETQQSYRIRIQTDDGNGGTFQKEFDITITNDTSDDPIVDTTSPTIDLRAPAIGAMGVSIDTDIVITFDENISLEEPGNVQLRLSSNNSEVASSKEVMEQTLTINPNSDLAYSTSYHVFIAGGAIQDLANNDFRGIADLAYSFTTVAPPNSAPSALSLSSNEIQENAGDNAEVGTLSTTDADVGDTHSYMLVSGIGGTDNALFDISNNKLLAKSSFDFETLPNSYSVRVRSTDAGGLFLEETFSISVTNDPSDDPPTDVTPPGVTLQDPAHNTFDHPIGADIEVTFDEDVMIGDPNDIFITRAVGNIVLSVTTSIAEGNKLIIDPDTDLEPGFLYRVTIVQDGIEDLAGNDFAGYSGSDYQFGAQVANSAPTNITLSPTSIQENNSIDDIIGTFTSTDANVGDSHMYSLVPIAGSTDHLSFYIDGNQLVADAIFDFETRTSFRINIQTDDGNGGLFQKEFDITIINDTSDDPVPDTTKPTIDARNPAIGATNVPVDSDVVITFSEDIIVVGDIFLFDGQNQVVPITVSTNGANLTLSPNNNLDPNETHKVSILSNVIRDAANNFFNGISFGNYNFTTAPPADNTAPTAVLSPTDDADDVPVDANFTLTFNEDVRFIDATSTNDALFLRIGTTVIEGFSASELNLTNNVLTVNPTNNLQNGQTYNIRIFNNLIEDLAATPNAYAGFNDLTSWNFTTAKLDQTIDFDPIPDKVSNDGPFMLNATASSMLTVTYASDNLSVATVVNNVVTIQGVGTANITASQSGNATYNPAPDVVRELRVTLADETAPTATLSPIDDADDVPVDANFTLTFDEDVRFVDATSTNDALFLRIGTAVIEGFSASELDLTNNVLTIDPTNDLQNGQTYNIRIFNNLIEDLAATPNAYAGFNDLTSWNFTTVKLDQTIDFDPIPDKVSNDGPFMLNATASSMLTVTYASDNLSVATVVNNVVTIQGVGTANITASQSGNATYNPAPDVVRELRVTLADETAPTATLSPTDDADDVSVDANFTLTFDEDVRFVDATSTNDALFLRIGTTVIEGFSASELDLTNNVLTIDPTNDLQNGQTYNIRIFNNLIEDLAATPNAYAGFNDLTSWNFTTVKLDQTIDFDPIATKTYGDNTFNLEERASSGLTINYTSTNTSVATVTNNTVTIVGAGTTNIVANQGGNFTYNAATEEQQTLTVNKRTLTATADNKSKIYGASNPALTISYSGFVNDDDDADINTDPDINTIADDESNVGSYDITLANGSDNNYQFNLVDGTLQVTRRTITATADNKSRIYGASNPALTISYSGFVNDDDASDIDTGPDINTIADEESSVGSYDITLANGNDNNYQFNLVDGTLQVTRRTLIATAEDKMRTFGENNPTFTIDYQGFVNGDDESDLETSPMASTTADATSNAGTYPINLMGGSDDNYAFDLRNGTLTVNKASQVIEIDPITDKEISALPFSVTATVGSSLPLDYAIQSGPATISGNTVTLSGTTGTVIVEVTQSGNINYLAASQTAIFNVLDPGLTDQTITFNKPEDKTFGDAPFELNATASSGLPVSFTVLSGPVSRDGIELTINGTGMVTIRASQPGNGSFNPAPVVVQSFTINKANQTITFDPITDKLTTDGPFDLVASSSSGLPLTFDISGPATLSGTTITLTGTTGTVAIIAHQAGNENYLEASGQVSFKVTEPVTINSRPSDISLSATAVAENLEIGTLIGEFSSTDPDANDQHTYSLVSGEGALDNGAFSLSGNQLLTAEVFDFEAQSSYSIRVRSDDQQGGTFEKSFTITIEDVSDDVVTSVEDDLLVNLQVYPNPSTHLVHIETNNTTSEGYVELFDLRGIRVIGESLHDHRLEMDVSTLNRGIYLLRVSQGGSARTVRLIIDN